MKCQIFIDRNISTHHRPIWRSHSYSYRRLFIPSRAILHFVQQNLFRAGRPNRYAVVFPLDVIIVIVIVVACFFRKINEANFFLSVSDTRSVASFNDFLFNVFKNRIKNKISFYYIFHLLRSLWLASTLTADLESRAMFYQGNIFF